MAHTARLVSGGEPIDCPRVAQPLIAALTASATQHSCSIPIYCIMPDHVHVILQGSGGNADTWRAMVAFKQRSGFWLSRHVPGTRWQKDFYDRILRSEEEVRDALVYIAANPPRAGLVRDPAEYPFTGSIGYGPAGATRHQMRSRVRRRRLKPAATCRRATLPLWRFTLHDVV